MEDRSTGIEWAQERDRLDALDSYQVMDTAPDRHFDALARLAARLCHSAIALITLLDDERQWFKSVVGMDLRETPRNHAFCAHTIQGEGLFEIPDACADPRFASNPLVAGELHLRFYAGVPLVVDGGHKLGALAVLDRFPRRLTAAETSDLIELASQVVLVLEERRLRLRAERMGALARQQSDSLLAIAGRVARLGAWEFDVGRNEVVWSEVVADIHGMPAGYSPDLGSALAFYDEPDRTRLTAAVADCMRNGTPFDVEMVLQPAEGKPPRWVRSIGEAVRGAHGQVTHLRGACQDITERKGDQIQMQHLTDRLVATLESIPDPFLAIGRDGKIEHVNVALEQLAQRDRRDLVGRRFANLLPPRWSPTLAEHCETVRSSGKPVAVQATDEASGRLFEVRIFAVEDGLTVHARDITAQEATLSRLRLLDACVHCLNDAVFITDTQLAPPGPTIVFANPAAERLCGWAPKELVGTSPRRLQGPATQRDRLDAMRCALANGEDFETELINYHRTGTPYWVHLKLGAVRDESGKSTHFVAIERDITERKASEAERHAVEHRLLQAQKMESIGTLAGGIAHDFNNVLGAVLGNVSLARDALPPHSPATAALETIARSAQRARALVQKILAFSSRQATHRSCQPLGKLIQHTLDLLSNSWPKAVAVRLSLPPQDVCAEIDGHQMEHVLLNLCTNAWHAMPPGGGTVEIGLAAVPPPFDSGGSVATTSPTWAHLWVKDDGCGIDGEAIGRIFEPFYSTKAPGEGTGLGLSVAHGIVGAHGGTIDVQSAAGAGTVFHIHLPSCHTPAAAAVEATTTPAILDLHGLRVVCVDDDPVMLMTMQALLEREGCLVSAFPDAMSALAELQRSPESTDLLVTDYNMPTMHGLDLVEKTWALRPGLKVVLASGFMGDGLSERAAAMGIRAQLNKERAVEDLIEVVLTALGQPHDGRLQ